MIIFKNLKWQNFLSTGNSFVEIDFLRSKTTLIVGENGAGKSTILDALSFALYGRPFRKINKPQLVNSINGKNLIVELNFSIGSHVYKIIRGMKPNIFEIYQNDKLLNQNSESKDYQEIFEKQFLKLNHKSFSQIVVLGTASFTPFMQLPAAHRREVIEDRLDIQIFSTMNILLKSKIQQNKEECAKSDLVVRLAEQKVHLFRQNTEKLKQNNDELISDYESKIKIAKNDFDICISLKNKEEDKNNKLNQKINDHDKVIAKLKTLDDLEYQIHDKYKKIKKEIGFYHDNDNCPTCKQKLHADFKETRINSHNESQIELDAGLIRLKEEKNKCHERIKEIEDIRIEINKNSKIIDELFYQTRTIENLIQSHNNSIRVIESQTSKIDIDGNQLEELSNELNDNIAKKNHLYEQKVVNDIASNLLKDSGIKTKIIKQYIPIMNKLINKYLASMDFFVNFELDENFEEKIKSRFRDEFSYQSFSEGEKLRIDLALLFTWRAISKLRSSACTNLLIMDEIFDSSLDTSGTEEFLKIIQSLDKDTNVFIISHKGDSLYDKFHSVIKFEKTKNFSRIAK